MPQAKNNKPFTVKDLLIYILAGVMALSGGVMVFMWYNDPVNMAIFGVVGMAALVGAGYFMFNRIYTPKSGTVINIDRPQTLTGNENAINFYVDKKADGQIYLKKLVFETMPKPEGQPHQLINNGKYFYLNRWDIDKKMLIPWELVDVAGISPDVLAKYIELPGQRKYLKHRDSIMKMLGPALLAVFDIVGFVVIIALAG